MTIEQLAKLVADMRHAQREYFRTRATSALHKSKRLELQVDDACRQVLNQKTLFTGPGERSAE